ncbi:hypothetical protein [Sphingobium sp. HDIP04]|uniref:hypothetical protein n=1 Tax=Sphingobium sp. HDIP04 TaxID=428994 RepID=UPI0003875D31|nr:hypothetical protein [Sphingobium sp. HDIP04]EQB03877.1 hypothetical protein L286_10965 [Sphingobium sp. HDIP04]
MSEAIGMMELLSLLERARPEASVYLDFGGYARPTDIDSYRGYYDRPALGFALGGYSGNDHGTETTVSDLIAELKRGMSQSYEGWKGGTYRYDGTEALFVDNPGDSSGIAVTGVIDGDWRVTITTAYLPDAY